MSQMSPDSDPDVQQAQEQESQPDEHGPEGEADRQAADTIRSISRLEESN